MKWDLVINFSLAMFAILNPLGKISIWEEWTGDKSSRVRNRIALLVTANAALVLITFLFGGKFNLNVFKSDLASFQIAGGIFLLLTDISMVNGKAIKLEHRDEIGGYIIPSRKKTVSTCRHAANGPHIGGARLHHRDHDIQFSSQGAFGLSWLTAVLLAIMVIIFLVFYISPKFEHKVDRLVFTVAIRMFGLILAAIAVQFMVEGLA